jgi:hypothetical protein
MTFSLPAAAAAGAVVIAASAGGTGHRRPRIVIEWQQNYVVLGEDLL